MAAAPRPVLSLRFLILVAVLLLAGACAGSGGGGVAGPENTVQIRLAGSGRGHVRDAYGSLDCPEACGPIDCSPGLPILMVATPDSGSTFAGWSGACTGTDTCRFVVSGHMLVTATFNR